MGLRGEGGDGEEEKIVAKLEISGMDVDDFVDKEFLSYDEELEDEASVVDEEVACAGGLGVCYRGRAVLTLWMGAEG